jgi:hypothetical protein
MFAEKQQRNHHQKEYIQIEKGEQEEKKKIHCDCVYLCVGK